MQNKEVQTYDKELQEILDKIKPLLNIDGGDIEFVKFEDGIVYVRLLGSCSDCPMSDNTIEDMIEFTLTFELPEVKKVINII